MYYNIVIHLATKRALVSRIYCIIHFFITIDIERYRFMYFFNNNNNYYNNDYI